MAVATKTGAWVTSTRVTRIDCSECGEVLLSRFPMNDRATDEAILKHAIEKHGGTDR